MPESVTLEFRMLVNTNPPHWQFSELVETAGNDAGLDRLARSNGFLYRSALLALAGMVADVDGEATGLRVNRDRSAWIYADFDRISKPRAAPSTLKRTPTTCSATGRLA